MLRFSQLVGGVLLLATAFSPARSAAPIPEPETESGPVPTLPLALPMKLGAFDMQVLRDADYIVQNDGKTFGIGIDTAEVQKVIDAQSVKKGRPASLGVDALLVRMPGRLVLFDTGLGAGAKGSLVGSLARAGFRPIDVTDVFITHSHGDHIGGLVDAVGKPAFPKATIRLSAKEWTFLQAQPGAEQLVAAISPQVKTFEASGRDIIPGVRAIATIGHTPGHSAYEIHSGKAKIFDLGDLAHSSIVSLARPEWVMSFDTDARLGAAERHAALTKLAASGEWVFAPHFPFPGTGRVVKEGNGFVWKPALK